jgi:hypothetical protein
MKKQRFGLLCEQGEPWETCRAIRRSPRFRTGLTKVEAASASLDLDISFPQKGQARQRPFGSREMSKVHPRGCQRLVVDRAGLRSFQVLLLVYFETDVTV